MKLSSEKFQNFEINSFKKFNFNTTDIKDIYSKYKRIFIQMFNLDINNEDDNAEIENNIIKIEKVNKSKNYYHKKISLEDEKKIQEESIKYLKIFKFKKKKYKSTK
jgi:hypothetical protein